MSRQTQNAERRTKKYAFSATSRPAALFCLPPSSFILHPSTSPPRRAVRSRLPGDDGIRIAAIEDVREEFEAIRRVVGQRAERQQPRLSLLGQLRLRIAFHDVVVIDLRGRIVLA